MQSTKIVTGNLWDLKGVKTSKLPTASAGKAWVTEWQLVLVYHLIGWEEFVRFSRPITKRSKAKLKQPWITRHSGGSCLGGQSCLLRPISLLFFPLQVEVPLVYSAFRMSGYTPSQVSYDVYALRTKRTAIYVWTHFRPSPTVRNNIFKPFKWPKQF